MILNRTPLYLRDDDFVVLLGMYFHDFLDENSKESCQMTQIDSILGTLVCNKGSGRGERSLSYLFASKLCKVLPKFDLLASSAIHSYLYTVPSKGGK